MSSDESEQLTCDVLFDGEISIWQRKKGYRFGLDALLLATDLPDVAEDATVVELGAGQGAVSLTMAHQHPGWTVIAVERQPSLLELLERNIAHNELDNVEIIAGDLRNFRDLLQPHSAELVVCNPPFFAPGDRRPSPVRERAEARHELHGGIVDFVAASAYVLEQRGWLEIFTPPMRMSDVFEAAEATDLSMDSLRFFHASRRDDAYLLDYVWRRGGAPDFSVRPPLYIYDSPGIYSPEVARRIGRERR